MAQLSDMAVNVNLWDANFEQSVCSVFGKTPQHVQYTRSQTNWPGVTIFTDEYINSPIVDQVQSYYKIGWLHEPQCLHPDTYTHALENLEKFDFILTYYQPFLEIDGFRFCPYGGVWIEREHWGLRPKTKWASMLYGTKMATDGHRLRHEIAALIRDKHPVDFYGAEGTPVDYSAETKRKVLADYQYTIITETCREYNLFTEILLDCFVVGTVPIFWGCPNVADYFDDTGILTFNEAQDVDFLLRHATDELYDEMLYSLSLNNDLAREYEITEDWLYDNVLRDLS